MIINSSKKALPLFNQLPEVADKKRARSFSDKNPLFLGMPITSMLNERKFYYWLMI